MASKTINDLSAIASATIAADDQFGIWDTSGSVTVKGAVSAILAALARLDSGPNFALGTATIGTSGTNVIALATGTVPTTQPADEFQLYSKDFEAGAGDARLHVQAESGNPVAIGNNIVAVPKPAATTGASQVGRALTVKAADAVASTDTAGAAAGGSLTLQAGAAARNTSGDAAGGSVLLLPQAGIGSGAAGTAIVRQPGGTPGTDEMRMYHDGTRGFIDVLDGGLRIRGVNGVDYFTIFDTAGNFMSGQQGSDSSYTIRGALVIGATTLGGAGAWNFSTAGVGITLGTGSYQFRSGNSGTNPDTGISRLAAGVIGINDASTGKMWIQNSGGHKALDAGPTSVSDTLANTNLAWTLIAGRTYSINMKITGGNSTAAEGAKFALTASGGLTATTFDLAVIGTNGTVVAGTTRVTALGNAINYTTFTATSDLMVVGEIKVNAGGTMTLQIATNAHSAGTLTVNAGTWGKINDMLAV